MEVALVYPHDADERSGKLSVLSDVGTAILGYQEGDAIDRIAYVMKRYIDRKVMPDYSTYLAYSAAKIGHQMDAVIASVSKVQADVNV